MTEVLEARDGHIPPRFSSLFPPELERVSVELIRLAGDDLSAMTGKVFSINVPPRNNSDTKKKEAEKAEQIAYGYNDAARRRGGPDMDTFMDIQAFWMVHAANSVMAVRPDYDLKTPFLDWIDPRTHYPPVGWSPWGQTALDDTLVAYQTTLTELMMRFPDRADELSRKYNKHTDAFGNKTKRDADIDVWVGEYYSTDAWYFATLEDPAVILKASESGDRGHPGVCGIIANSLYSATRPKGRSIFAGQVGFEAAMSRMFSQKLQFFDRTLHPMIFTTPLTHPHLRIGPNGVNILDPTLGIQPRVEVISPANPVDADQTMGFVMGLSRVLNRNPESFQGAGEADSAKALSELKAGINMVIQDHLWPPMIRGLQQAYRAAAHMDIEVWGNTKKKANGRRRNTPFTVDYTPNVHIKPYVDDIMLERGIGVGGYPGKLEIMQMLGARLISKRTALEEIPEFTNPEDELRRIQSDQLEEVIFADLTNMAAQGILQPGAIARLHAMVNDDDKDLFQALGELDEQGALRIQPPQGEAAAGGAPSDIAGAAAALEGGGTDFNLPSLRALRG